MPTDHTTPAPDTPIQTCGRCGCTSPLARLYRKVGRAGLLCPRCYVKYTEQQQRRLTLTVGLAIATLALLALLARRFGLGPPFLLGNILLIVFALYGSIVGHELAHALAGWLTGGCVYEIRLGGGPDLLKLRVGELVVRVRRYLAGGNCVVLYPAGRQQRWRLAVLLSAGMLFHLLVIVALLPGFPHEDPGRMWIWRDALVITNAALLLSILLSRQALTQDGLVAADAAQIRQILTTPWDATARVAATHNGRAVLAWQRGDYVRAEAAARAGLEIVPGQPLAVNMHGVALLELGRPAEARVLFEKLAAPEMEAEVAKLAPDADSQLMIQALNRNNLAYATLMLPASEPELLQARELAEAAFAIVPWDPSIEGTLGAALLETGAVEEGLRHLEAAGRHYDTPRAQASNLAWRALGHHRLGQVEQAQALLEQAARLDGAHPGIQLIRQKMSDPSAHSEAGHG